MSEIIPAREFRRLMDKTHPLKRPRKKKAASASEKAAETVDRSVRAVAARALRAAGYDPKAGYVLHRSLTLEPLYVAVPTGLYRIDMETKP